MPEKLNIRIADVSLSIEGDERLPDKKLLKAYSHFISAVKGEVSLRLHTGPPEIKTGEILFDSTPIWTLHRSNSAAVFNIFGNYPSLRRLLFLPENFQHADLYFAGNPDVDMDPFFGPTMELLMINYLACGRGTIVHACGVEYNGKGYLFAGESGAGKSTLARLLDQEKGIKVLSDDRIVLRKQDGGVRIYGTPWHGEETFSAIDKT
jgi:hypothetical protein